MVSTLSAIVHSTDAGVDDFVATALLLAAQKVCQNSCPFNCTGAIITAGDCEPVSAFDGYQKMKQLFNSTTMVGLSNERVWTPFPWVWRMESLNVSQLPCLNTSSIRPLPYSVDGDQKLLQAIQSAKNVSIVATGPLTSISRLLQQHPELESHISTIHWMGGALDIPGNLPGSPEVPPSVLNDKAEWNVFSDPFSAGWLFTNTNIPMHVYPIDLSNQTDPVKFVEILAKKTKTIYSDFVNQAYAIVAPFPDYRMWDVVAAAGRLFPQVFNPPSIEKIRIEVTGPNQGAFVRDQAARPIFIYKEFKNNDPSAFYDAVASTLALTP